MIQVRVWLHPRHLHGLEGDDLSDYVARSAGQMLRTEAGRVGVKLVGKPEVVDILSPRSPDALEVRHLWDETGPGAWDEGVSLAYVQQPARRRWVSRFRRTDRGPAGSPR